MAQDRRGCVFVWFMRISTVEQNRTSTLCPWAINRNFLWRVRSKRDPFARVPCSDRWRIECPSQLLLVIQTRELFAGGGPSIERRSQHSDRLWSRKDLLHVLRSTVWLQKHGQSSRKEGVSASKPHELNTLTLRLLNQDHRWNSHYSKGQWRNREAPKTLHCVLSLQ
mgnify:FL=1